MSVRRLHGDQPTKFAFTRENLSWARAQIKKYPPGKKASAIIPLMWCAQAQHDGWLPEPAIRYVADMLDMPYIRALEVATFYTMFQLQPVGRKAHVQVCGTTPCMILGAGDLIKVCQRRIAEAPHALSENGDFSWEEVECLGACVNAPMVQVDSDTYEDLTPEIFEKILDKFAAGKRPKPGPQSARRSSEPAGGLTTLVNGAAAPAKKAAAAKKMTATPAAPPPGILSEAAKPELLTAPRGGSADDLKLISGVGPKLEKVLHDLGVYHYAQIADWTGENIFWVDEKLKFRGRIEREGWIEQAKTLAAGGETAFSKRRKKAK